MALSSSMCAEVVMKPYILSATFARNITMRSTAGDLDIHTAWVLDYFAGMKSLSNLIFIPLKGGLRMGSSTRFDFFMVDR